jgi:hypothetical protein
MKKWICFCLLLLLASCWDSPVQDNENIVEDIVPVVEQEPFIPSTEIDSDTISIPEDTGPDL